MSFTLCCCGKKFKRRRSEPYSALRRTIYSFLFTLALAWITAAAVGGLRASGVFSQGIQNIFLGLNGAVKDTSALITGISPTVTAAITVLSTALDDTLNSVVQNVTNGFTNNAALSTAMNNANTTILELANRVDQTLTDGATVDTDIKAFLAFSTTLQTALSDLATKLSALNDEVIESDPSKKFQIASQFSIPAGLTSSTLLGNVTGGTIPDLNAQLDNLRPPNIPDLRTLSQNLTTTYLNLSSMIKDAVVGPDSGTLFTLFSPIFK
jgi:hypothetical protein